MYVYILEKLSNKSKFESSNEKKVMRQSYQRCRLSGYKDRPKARGLVSTLGLVDTMMFSFTPQVSKTFYLRVLQYKKSIMSLLRGEIVPERESSPWHTHVHSFLKATSERRGSSEKDDFHHPLSKMHMPVYK